MDVHAASVTARMTWIDWPVVQHMRKHSRKKSARDMPARSHQDITM